MRKMFVFTMLVMSLGVSLCRADSGNEAYCKCKGSPTVAECKACCKQDCHDTNWGGDFWGLCTSRCQKNCDLYGGAISLMVAPDSLITTCIKVEIQQTKDATLK